MGEISIVSHNISFMTIMTKLVGADGRWQIEINCGVNYLGGQLCIKESFIPPPFLSLYSKWPIQRFPEENCVNLPISGSELSKSEALGRSYDLYLW